MIYMEEFLRNTAKIKLQRDATLIAITVHIIEIWDILIGGRNMFNLKRIRSQYSSLPYNDLTKHHYQIISHGRLNYEKGSKMLHKTLRER